MREFTCRLLTYPTHAGGVSEHVRRDELCKFSASPRTISARCESRSTHSTAHKICGPLTVVTTVGRAAALRDHVEDAVVLRYDAAVHDVAPTVVTVSEPHSRGNRGEHHRKHLVVEGARLRQVHDPVRIAEVHCGAATSAVVGDVQRPLSALTVHGDVVVKQVGVRLMTAEANWHVSTELESGGMWLRHNLRRCTSPSGLLTKQQKHSVLCKCTAKMDYNSRHYLVLFKVQYSGTRNGVNRAHSSVLRGKRLCVGLFHRRKQPPSHNVTCSTYLPTSAPLTLFADDAVGQLKLTTSQSITFCSPSLACHLHFATAPFPYIFRV